MGDGLNIASLFLGGIPCQEDEGVSVNILTETCEGICAARADCATQSCNSGPAVPWVTPRPPAVQRHRWEQLPVGSSASTKM